MPIILVGSNRSMETGQPLRLKYACEISNRLETLIEKQSLEVLDFIRADLINFISMSISRNICKFKMVCTLNQISN